MNLLRLDDTIIVERTLEDEGTVWPDCVFHTDEIVHVEVHYVDVEHASVTTYRRITPTPILKHKINPLTFQYTMTPIHIWNQYINGMMTDQIEMIASKSIRIKESMEELNDD